MWWQRILVSITATCLVAGLAFLAYREIIKASDLVAIASLGLAGFTLFLGHRERTSQFRQAHHSRVMDHAVKLCAAASTLRRNASQWSFLISAPEPDLERLRLIGAEIQANLRAVEEQTDLCAILSSSEILSCGAEFLNATTALLNFDKSRSDSQRRDAHMLMARSYSTLITLLRFSAGIDKVDSELSALLQIPPVDTLRLMIDEHANEREAESKTEK